VYEWQHERVFFSGCRRIVAEEPVCVNGRPEDFLNLPELRGGAVTLPAVESWVCFQILLLGLSNGIRHDVLSGAIRVCPRLCVENPA
jgi:hypothetical protein